VTQVTGKIKHRSRAGASWSERARLASTPPPREDCCMHVLLALTDSAGRQLSQPEMWVLMGLGAAGLIYLIVIRPMMRKKDPLEKPPAFASLSQQRAVERQMQNLLVELSEMARQITAQLDTRAAKLELLLKEADQKIAALHAGERGNNGSSLPPPTMVSSDPTLAAISDEPDPRHAEVYALADQGRDPYEIASQLGRPRGEVELILALRNK
jgi:hypothetical protein